MAVSRNVTVIPAIKRIGNNKNSESKPKIRVAAYCRVSTDSEEQASSYEIQIEHYTNYIKRNKGWELAGIFADDGITGTSTKKRDEFNRMIEECMAGNIDMIITKSISRFARNTLDCLKYIRQLKDKNIAVFFEKESINTMDSKGEILLTIMASLAQQENQSLSQNVKLGIQYRYQQGEVQVNHKRFLGYTKDENKQLVIDPEGAKVVKRIYREYLEGASLLQIARGLEADGILTAAGKAKWRPETLKKILQNEKYIGDALLQKTYTVDFLSKKRVKNNGIVPQYYVENSHEPIIPRELFMQVQEEMVRRANLRAARVVKSEFIVVSMPYQVLFTADNAVIFTDEYIGITEVTSLLFGDIVHTNYELKNFLKRLNYYLYKRKKQELKYIATWEKQKRGSIHYHIIFFSLPYIKKKKLEEIWGHGFIKINHIAVDSKENRGRYVSKYFAKELELKEHKKKAFFTSQNLKKPHVRKLALTPEQIQMLTQENVAFTKEYTRKTYLSETFRIGEDENIMFKDTVVTYLKIKK